MDLIFTCIAVSLIIVMFVLFIIVLGIEEQPHSTWQQPKNEKYNMVTKEQSAKYNNYFTESKQKEILRLENLTVVRGRNCVLRKIGLNIYEGERLAIIGESGAGKSTLVSSIRGEIVPTQGTVIFDGKKLRYDSASLSQHYINVPMIDQSASSLVPFHSILKSIVKQLLVKGMPQDQANDVAYNCLRTMKIEDKVDSLPEQLSGGEKQRAVVAKALSMGNSVKLLLADEPTSSLDPPLARDIIKSLTARNFAIIFITHQIELVMNDVDRILLLLQGKLHDVTIIKKKYPRYFTEFPVSGSIFVTSGL